MAGAAGKPSFSLRTDLLKKGHEFSFFQVMRLLRLLSGGRERHKAYADDANEPVRFRAELSLAFPASDIARVEETADETPFFRVTTTFLGLYGVSSPLPTFYTEDLMEEASADLSVRRDFMDVLNHPLFLLLFRCWAKYRPFVKVAEENDTRDLERLFCFLGLGEEELRRDIAGANSLLRYIGLFTQFPRSAAGLRTMLQDAFGNVPIEVIPAIKRKVKIPADQRMMLGTSGCSLSVDSFLGEEIDDRMGKFRLRIGPLSSGQFQPLLPGNEDHRRLAFLTKFYLNEPLEFDITLALRDGEAQTACLGSPMWSRLGLDTWTFSGARTGEVHATFPPHL